VTSALLHAKVRFEVKFNFSLSYQNFRFRLRHENFRFRRTGGDDSLLRSSRLLVSTISLGASCQVSRLL
jgi:hypothetical protein